MAAIFGGLGLAVVAGYAGGTPVGPGTLARVVERGPAVVGLALAAAVGLGLRSGAHGGPLAVERADVHVVLLAPVSRRQALLGPALRQLRFAAFTGAVLGLVAGTLASRRLPGAWAGWVAAGAAAGAVTGLAAVGAALVVSGLRAGRWATPAATALVAWSAVDVWRRAGSSPATSLGRLALRPAGVRGEPRLGPACALALAGAGVALVGRTAIVAAQRRSALLSQLRFAATLQDVRTVVLLRRLLAQEASRARPWLRLGRRPSRHPVWRRDAQGVLRWPAVRVVRALVLGALAGGALVLAWRGTVVLVAAAGLALFLGGLDAVEGLAQEVDRPVRRDTLPVARRWLTGQHMVVPLVVMVAVAGAGVLAAVGAGGAAAAPVGGATVLPAALGAVCAAVLSVASEPYDPLAAGALDEPELVASTRLLVRVGAAPALATAGVLPVLAARSTGAAGATAAAAALTALLAAAAVASVRPRDRTAPR